MLIHLPLSALGAAPYLLVTVVLSAVGIRAADVAERVYARSDDGRIVIDEIVGQLAALAPLVLLEGGERARSPGWLVTAFVAFRLFDIWKPGPVGWAERRFSGGAGVVLDDLAAGLLAAATVAVAMGIA